MMRSTVQALADVATIGILQERAIRESDVARQQLQHALNSRVLIEQAKGVLAYTHNVNMDEAFTLLREYARRNGQPLVDVAPNASSTGASRYSASSDAAIALLGSVDIELPAAPDPGSTRPIREPPRDIP